jgi:hypothetical protein
MILEERRSITRRLIAESGCGCGGCSSCKASLSAMSRESMGHEHEMEPEVEGLVISYDDDGLPDPKHYMDHAEAGALTQSYPYEQDTHGDIVHGHSFGQSYMAKQHLHTIVQNSDDLLNMIGGDEELEDWCESKLAVASSMVQAVKNFVEYYKGASHEKAESHSPMHGMHSLMRVLDEE